MIELIVEFPLEALQTDKAKSMDITTHNCCVLCGKKIKSVACKQVQLLQNGNIVSTDQPIEGSQGFFPVGPECYKKLVLNFAW